MKVFISYASEDLERFNIPKIASTLEESPNIERGDRMGGLQKVIDNNKIDLKVKILQIARDIIVQDPGISEKKLLRQLRDGKLIPRQWVIGDITDLFSLTHNELLLLCLTGSIPSNIDSIRLLVS